MNKITNPDDKYLDDMLDLNSHLLNYNPNAFPRQPVYKLNKNINSIQDLKFFEIENSRDKIERIHCKLMNKQPVSSGGNS